MSEKSDKLPAFQFYPSDWRNDPAVMSLCRHDRSVWMDIICIMHDSPERGVLLLPNGRPMSDEELIRNLGLPSGQGRKSIAAILDTGTASRREDGALVNRRMVRDEHLRQVRKACGGLGGNPNLVNQKVKQKPTTHLKQKPTPSSSFPSSSSTSEEKGTGKGTGEGAVAPSVPESEPILSFGEFGRALMTQEQHDKLEAKLNGNLVNYIARFDGWVNEAPKAKARDGVRREDRHAYESINSWWQRDLAENKVPGRVAVVESDPEAIERERKRLFGDKKK